MIKIGIELNGVIRDINKQYLKYYLKDINPEFEDENFDLNVVDALKNLKFESESAKQSFVFEDYPYELFGCAQPMTRNLHTFINGWIYDLYWKNNFDDVSVFSLGEDELTIQSTYFYLSKSGTRVRNVVFPRKAAEVWDMFDVVITTNKEIVNTKPQGKIVILIEKSDNKELIEKSDFVYNNLIDVLGDTALIDKLNIKPTHKSFFNKIKEYIKKIF